ncbi:MAG: GNAT family N-acetyltransferase [Candidatus Melainabacteria bacterium]|nr:GNAT family N-acetyltransferase [Candidatus Melainabacteria bacterium]
MAFKGIISQLSLPKSLLGVRYERVLKTGSLETDPIAHLWVDINRKGCAMVDHIGVAPSHQGQGLGTRLLQEFIAFARKHPKINQIVLQDVSHSARTGQRSSLYQRLGFLPGKQPGHWQLDVTSYSGIRPVR